MPIETVSPNRLYRQVADQLLALIDKGEFPVGARLPPERDLAAQFGVSRPTVREALIALEVHGRVHIRVGSGIYVLPEAEGRATAGDLSQVSGPFEILEARALFEGAVAEAAALKASPADVAALDAILEAMISSLNASGEILALDRQFHAAIAAILGNGAVTVVVGELFDQRMNPYFEHLARYFENAETWRAAYDEHRTIRDRIAAGDGPGARAAMRSHLTNSQRRFSENFQEPPAAGVGRPARTYAQKPRRRRTAAG